jgi:hypothetical protein
MKILYDKLVIGGLVLGLLIVIGAYFGSRWFYRDLPGDTIEISDRSLPDASDSRVMPSAHFSPLNRKDSTRPQAVDATVDVGLKTHVAGTVNSESEGVMEAKDDEASDEPTEAKVSPYGFGPYPPIPPDYPYPDLWEAEARIIARGIDRKEHELINRVLIKLWNEGERPLSGTMENRKVYPLYPNTIYVRWEEEALPDGTVRRYLAEVTGLPEMRVYSDLFDEDIIPPGIQTIDLESSGIDPYTFLNFEED